MPESYGNFAQVYDTFMDDTDYEAWTDRVIRMRDKYGLPAEQTGAEEPDPAAQERQLICDIGCGTGRVTEILASRGYDVMGIDLSPDMLAIAQERSRSAGRDTLYLCQDMRELELYGRYEEQAYFREYQSVVKIKMMNAIVDMDTEIPVKFVIERAIPADKKTYPKKSLIVLLSTVSAFILAVLVLLTIDKIKSSRPEDEEA